MTERTAPEKASENAPRVPSENAAPGKLKDYRLELEAEQRRRLSKEGVHVPEGKSWNSFYDDR